MYLCCVKRLLLGILLIFAGLSSVAQTNVVGDVIVRHYTADDGLPNDIVNSVVRSSDGFMWFGTWYGLARFDGIGFHSFPSVMRGASAQPPRKVETVVEDGRGNLWIKTLDWRLSVLFKQEERFKDVYNELKPFSRNLQIIKIQSDGNGNVLLLTKDKNLLLGSTTADDDVSLRLLANSRGVVDASSYRLKDDLVDIRGGYASWVGRDYGIFTARIPKDHRHDYADKAFWRSYFQRQSLSANTHTDHAGNQWTIGRTSIEYYNPHDGRRKTFAIDYGGDIARPAFFDGGSHGVFILTAGGWAYCVNPSTLQLSDIGDIARSADGTGGRYLDMLFDKDGILWLTTADDGFYSLVFPPRQFHMIELTAGAGGIRSLFQLDNGDVWVGTRSKDLFVLDSEGNQKARLAYAQYHIGSVYNIMTDSRGHIWLSTKGDGLVKAERDGASPCGYRFTHYRHESGDKSSLSGNNVYMAYEDSHHHIWVGTLDGGLNLMNEAGGRVSFLNKFNGMSHYPGYGQYMEVRNMAEDREGRLWIGTIDGLMSLGTDFKSPAGIRFDTYRGQDGGTLAGGDVSSLFRDSHGNIWVCTFGGGVSRITDSDNGLHPVLDAVGVREGLENDVIVSMAEDRHGDMWLANADGVACLERRTNRVRTFGRTDGLPKVRMEEAAAMTARDGTLWLGSHEGILTFNPDGLRRSKSSFPVRIIGCTVNNADISTLDNCLSKGSITYADELELRYNQNMFTLEYAALNYVNPQNVTYRHRLEGFDRDWHYDGHRRIASYTNVPPGDYTFIVEATDGSNPDHPSVCRLHIVITPPWWATWWAYTLYIIIGLTAILLVLRYARYQIRLKNDLYVKSQVAEFKRTFSMQQEDKLFAERLDKIIEDNLANEDFDIGVLAGELGMSRSALFKKVKAMTGDSPSEYIKDLKLRTAVDLLKHSNKSITEIAYASGFSDAGYFGKCFRKKYGMSPRAYKQQE